MDKLVALHELASVSGIDNDPSGLQARLIEYINHLLVTDFDKLISLLYRLDVDEQLLRKMLRDYPDTNAGTMIADLMIDRQIKKIESRRKFNQRDNNIDENEKW